MNTIIADVDVVKENRPVHYVDWGAIVGGTFVAAAISWLFLAFGSAIGLSFTSFYNSGAKSIVGLLIAATLWVLWIQVSSAVGGGYIAGRLRHKIGDGTDHEMRFRDGSHGLIVWAIGVVVTGILASWLATAGIAGIGAVAGRGALTPNSSASMDYYVDRLLRAKATLPPGGNGSATDLSINSQISRILTRSIVTPLDEPDRAFVVQEIGLRSGLPEPEAQKRLDETLATLKADADKARKYGILVAFLTAASLLISGAAGWWAGVTGGRHRNEGVDHSLLTYWR
jgi:hypothetical protein